MLTTTIEQDLLTARKNDAKHVKYASEQKETLTLLKASLQNEAIKKQADLTDDDAIKIIRSNVKQLNQTLDSAKSAKRDELIEKTQRQIAILTAYLPATLSVDELFAKIENDSDFNHELNFGNAMKLLMSKFKGQVEGKTAKEALTKYLK